MRKPILTVPRQTAMRGRGAAVFISALAMALAGCAGDITPPFQMEDDGDIEGRAFYDVAGDGEYAPGGGDFPLAGYRVELRERGTERVLPGGEAITDDRGRFAFLDVAPGTHDVFLDTTNLQDMAICRNPRPASVYVNETQYVAVTTAEGCVIAISAAKALPAGEFVLVEGVVTVGQGRHRADNIYVQDLSAGIQIFGVSSSLGLTEGDSIQVTGTMGAFRGEVQIVEPDISVLGEGTVPEPRLVTGAEINELTYEGELVRTENAEVASVGSADFNGRYNVTFTAADGETFQIRIESGILPEVPIDSWTVGGTYHITGALGSFEGTAQIKPRTAADIEPVE